MAQDALIRIRAKVDGQAEVQALERQFRRTESQTQKLKQSFSGLATVAARLGGAFAVFQGLRFTLIKTAELQTQTKSLEVLTGSLEQAQTVIKELQEFGAVTPFTSSELIQTAKLLKAYNIDTAKLVDTTKRLGDVAGATGGDLEGIARAFGQIQSRGSLQAEELNQLRERGVDIETALREAYDLSGAEFADAMRKNQISAEAVFAILERITSAGGKYAGGAISQSTTLAGKFSTLQDNVDQLARSFGEALTPAVEDALDNANNLVKGLSDVNFEAVKTVAQIGLVTGAVIALRKAFESMLALQLVTALSNIRIIFAAFGSQIAITAAAQGLLNKALAVGTGLMSALPVTALALGVVGLADALRQAATDQGNFNKLLQEGTVAELEAALATERGNLALLERQQIEGRGAGRAADASRLKRARDRVQILEGQLAEGMIGGGSLPQGSGLVDPPKLRKPDGTDADDAEKAEDAYKKFTEQVLKFQIERENGAKQAIADIQEETKFAQLRLEQGEDFANAVQRVNELVQQGVPFSEAFQLVEARENVRRLQEAQDDANQKAEQQANTLKDLYKSIGDTIENNFVSAIEGLVDGTKSLAESLSGLLRQLGGMFLRQGVGSIFDKIFPSAYGNVVANNKIVPFAYGGVVNKPTLFPMANGAGLMGEAGPEAIMPLRRTASGRLGVESSGGVGNVVVNVDATGSSVQGDQPNADLLGKAIGAAVQAELIKQKRPGGLLTR
jgi:tape measure domain-containing protein